jgi:nitrogen fixation NifU-like protein
VRDAVYGAIVLEHFRRPRNQRTLDAPSARHEAFNPLCGDRVRIDVATQGDRIVFAAFEANACAVCTAAASLLTERISGMMIGDALEVADDEILNSLGAQLPAARIACATLPLRALHGALAQLAAT